MKSAGWESSTDETKILRHRAATTASDWWDCLPKAILDSGHRQLEAVYSARV